MKKSLTSLYRDVNLFIRGCRGVYHAIKLAKAKGDRPVALFVEAVSAKEFQAYIHALSMDALKRLDPQETAFSTLPPSSSDLN